MSRSRPRSWAGTKSRPAFRGYPIATIAFYGPNDKLATKVAVSVLFKEGDEPLLKRWLSKGETDVRHDAAIGKEVAAFLRPHAPRTTVAADQIMGCPHEEGIDYPEGASCPKCSFWAGRDRFTHERIQ